MSAEHYATLTTGVQAVRIPSGSVMLNGDLAMPPHARGLVLFAHGSGSSRHSSRNRYVASALHEDRIGTLLMDLLTPEEEQVDLYTRHLRFDIDLLARRLESALEWLAAQAETAGLPTGLFGASTGAGAALVTAAHAPGHVDAVVSRGGRPDLAGSLLPRVTAPTLLIVGGYDYPVIELNQQALSQMRCEKHLEIVPGATHLFEEPGTLEVAAAHARNWFDRYLQQGRQQAAA